MKFNLMTSTAVTMNSIEIADLVQSQHGSVKRAIDRLVKRGVIELPPMVKVEQNQSLSPNNKSSAYVFSGEKGKRDSLIVVAQLSPEFTGAIVDRWIELEKQAAAPKLPDFTNPVEAARAWADEYEAKQVALIQLEQARPKIEHYDTVVERSTLLNATQVAQKLGLTAQKLNKVLDMLNVYDKRVRRCRAFTSWFVQEGLGEMKQTFTGHSQALFTTKGEAWVIEQLSEGV